MSDKKAKKIRERIRKLLAMAGDASSPNEAAIAAKRAKALLDEHNLSEADVIAGGMTLDDFQARDVGEVMRRFPKWISMLGPAIARYTGTSVIFHLTRGPAPKRAPQKQARYRGHVDDLMLAEYLHVYLVRTIERLTQAAGLKGLGPRASFRFGMAQSIGQKLREMAAEEDAWFRRNGGKALVMVDKKAAMNREKFGVTRYSHRATHLSNGGAYALGQRAGRDVNIHRGLAGTSKTPAGYIE